MQPAAAIPPAALGVGSSGSNGGSSGSNGSSAAWQQQDVRTLDQLQRSSELLLQLQKQQQRQQWWGGLLFPSSSGSNGSSGGGWYPSFVAAAPAGRSPERASSTSLSVISEDEATCVPHPFQPLRLEGWLRRLDEQREQQLQQSAATAS
jgi:hypothetical protein